MNIVFFSEHKRNNSLWKCSLLDHNFHVSKFIIYKKIYINKSHIYIHNNLIVGKSIYVEFTWTIAMWSNLPRKPTAIEAAAITAGPVRNLTAIAKEAIEFPHAIILGWRAMNRPEKCQVFNNFQNQISTYQYQYQIHRGINHRL